MPAAGRAPYEANTNLTQISDWITKTIVGVGLVNWERELRWFNSTADALGTGLQIGPSGFSIGGSIIARVLAGADSAFQQTR